MKGEFMKKLSVMISLFMATVGFAYAQAQPPRGTIRTFATGIYNQSIVIDASGNLWIASAPPLILQMDEKKTGGISFGNIGFTNHKIDIKFVPAVSGQTTLIEVSPAGAVMRAINQVAPPEWPAGQWWGAYSLGVDAAGNIYVPMVLYEKQQDCDFIHRCYNRAAVYLVKINSSGLPVGTYNTARAYSDEWVPKVLVDSSGNIFVASTSDKLGEGIVSKFDPSGTMQGVLKLSNRVYAIAMDKAGNIWGTNKASDDVAGVSPAGIILPPIHARHATTGIAIDQAGNFWVGVNSHEIEKIGPDGTILATAPTPNNTGDGPRVIRVDGAGNIWAVNQSNQPNQGSTVLELNLQGAVTATYPMPNAVDLAIDKQGNVWVINSLPAGNNLYEIVGVAEGVK